MRKINSSGTWRCVPGRVVPHVSKHRDGVKESFLESSTLKMTLRPSETSVPCRRTTQCHVINTHVPIISLSSRYTTNFPHELKWLHRGVKIHRFQQHGCTFTAELTARRKSHGIAGLLTTTVSAVHTTYLGIFVKGRTLTTSIPSFSLVSPSPGELSTPLLGPAALCVWRCCCPHCPTPALQPDRHTADT